jgi:long-chain fatty acid transport protein
MEQLPADAAAALVVNHRLRHPKPYMIRIERRSIQGKAMQTITRNTRSLLLAGSILTLMADEAGAAGFAVHGQSTSQLGNAFAGVAASAPDASTVWWNPAGMALIEKTQGVLFSNLMRTSTHFHDIASAPALGQPLGTEGGNAGTLRITGGMYGVYSVNERWRAGIGVNTPFGLRTIHDGEWMGRFQAQKSESMAVNVNPAIAYKMSDTLTIGGGVNVQRFEATLTNAVNYTAAAVNAGLATGAIAPGQVPALVNPAAPGNIAGMQGTAHLNGDDWGLGWNVGFIYKPTKDLSFGAHYRSQISYTIEGDVAFSAPAATTPLAASLVNALSAAGGPLSSGPASARLTVPESLSMSAVIANIDGARKIDLLFDATWFGWSRLDEVVFVRSDGTALSRLNFQWRDTWRLAAGLTYKHNASLHLRLGYAYDQAAVNDERTRSPRLPEFNRHWFAAGSRHVLSKNTSIDTGISFVKGNNARIPLRSDPSAAASGVLDGDFRTSSLTLSGQLNWSFD